MAVKPQSHVETDSVFMRITAFKGTTIALWVMAALLIATSAWSLLTLQYDHWDGAIYHMAALSSDFEGVHHMHQQVGGFLQGALFYGFEAGTHLFGSLFRSIFLLNALLVFGLGIYLCIRAVVGENFSPAVGLFSASLIPLAALASSSMIATIYLFLGLGLIGCSLFSHRSFAVKTVGIFLVYTGMQVVHAAPALIGLALLVSFMSNVRSENGGFQFWREVWRAAVIGGTLVALFLIGRMFFPSTGLYSSYGAITLAGIVAIVARTASTATSIGLPFLIVMVSVAVCLFPVSGLRGKPLNEDAKRALMFLAGGIAIILLNAIPLAITGRSTGSILQVVSKQAGTELFRYTIFGIALAQIGLGVVLNTYALPRGRYFQFLGSVTVSCLIGLTVFFSQWNDYRRLDSAQADIVVRWQNVAATQSWTPSAACRLPQDGPAASVIDETGYSLRLYDLHFLHFAATGNDNRFMCGGKCTPQQQLRLLNRLCASPKAAKTYGFAGTSCADVRKELDDLLRADRPLPLCYKQAASSPSN